MTTRHKLLSILAVLTLLLATPLMAQVANLSDEPPVARDSAQQQSPDQGDEGDVDLTASAGATVQDDSASAEASLSADTDEGVDAEAETRVQADTASGNDTDSMSSQDDLPETAGPLGLLAVLGTTGLASAFGLRRLRRS